MKVPELFKSAQRGKKIRLAFLATIAGLAIVPAWFYNRDVLETQRRQRAWNLIQDSELQSDVRDMADKIRYFYPQKEWAELATNYFSGLLHSEFIVGMRNKRRPYFDTNEQAAVAFKNAALKSGIINQETAQNIEEILRKEARNSENEAQGSEGLCMYWMAAARAWDALDESEKKDNCHRNALRKHLGELTEILTGQRDIHKSTEKYPDSNHFALNPFQHEWLPTASSSKEYDPEIAELCTALASRPSISSVDFSFNRIIIYKQLVKYYACKDLVRNLAEHDLALFWRNWDDKTIASIAPRELKMSVNLLTTATSIDRDFCDERHAGKIFQAYEGLVKRITPGPVGLKKSESDVLYELNFLSTVEERVTSLNHSGKTDVFKRIGQLYIDFAVFNRDKYLLDDAKRVLRKAGLDEQSAEMKTMSETYKALDSDQLSGNK